MKKILSILMCFAIVVSSGNVYSVYGKGIEDNDLYALGACLMDGDSGRVLFEKNGYEKYANASTTKIMTCILALEYGDLNDKVKFSKYAAGMPDVQLNAMEGDEFYLKDLLHSLMLESHNDSAVAIAEHIGGSVEMFAEMMNQKARDLGCYDTFFITPNGLDAVDEEGNIHSTTASDLCKIMSYCIKNKEFVEITNVRNYSFTNVTGTRNYSVSNKNAFLDMMDGVISGKTGFTNDAGYCYVAALERDGNTYVIALLGCGWPYNKNYKWKDSKTLFNYGINEYDKYRLINDNVQLPNILLLDAKVKKGNISEDVYINCYIKETEFEVLTRGDETVNYQIEMKNVMNAPVKKGQIVGKLKYYIGDEIIKELNIYAGESVEKIDFEWIYKTVWKKFFLS